MNLLCLLFGHRPDGKLFRKPEMTKAISQRPDLRGREGYVETGIRCSRCRKDVEK